MKAICIFIGLVLLLAMVYENNSIEVNGTVMDAVKKIPLKESHIYVKGTHIVSIADEEGAFSLKVPLIYRNKPLIVSYVGYANFEEDIAKLRHQKIQVDMQPTFVVMEEVLVKPDKELLIDQAIDNALSKYKKPDQMLMDFYQTLLAMDEDHHVWEKVNESIDLDN